MNAYSIPRTVPGTPTDFPPTAFSFPCTCPSLSRTHIAGLAFAGAFSLKFTKALVPSSLRININPPPPIPEAFGSATPIANEMATAASMAFPPAFKISMPALDASYSPEETTACVPFASRPSMVSFPFSSQRYQPFPSVTHPSGTEASAVLAVSASVSANVVTSEVVASLSVTSEVVVLEQPPVTRMLAIIATAKVFFAIFIPVSPKYQLFLDLPYHNSFCFFQEIHIKRNIRFFQSLFSECFLIKSGIVCSFL